jgi:hypothetical protein
MVSAATKCTDPCCTELTLEGRKGGVGDWAHPDIISTSYLIYFATDISGLRISILHIQLGSTVKTGKERYRCEFPTSISTHTFATLVEILVIIKN